MRAGSMAAEYRRTNGIVRIVSQPRTRAPSCLFFYYGAKAEVRGSGEAVLRYRRHPYRCCQRCAHRVGSEHARPVSHDRRWRLRHPCRIPWLASSPEGQLTEIGTTGPASGSRDGPPASIFVRRVRGFAEQCQLVVYERSAAERAARSSGSTRSVRSTTSVAGSEISLGPTWVGASFRIRSSMSGPYRHRRVDFPAVRKDGVETLFGSGVPGSCC